MNRVRKFLALHSDDRWLLANAFLVLAAMRLRLALLPFRAGAGCPRSRTCRKHPTPDRIAWAVDVAGSCLGNPTCLARALAGHRMLARRGFSSRVSIGVAAGAKTPHGGSLIAHAWLEIGGRILLGGPDVGQYTPLLTWGNS